METNRQEHEKKVVNAIDTVRPYLQADGGDVVFKELTDDNVVKVQLQGACGSCPHAIATLKHGGSDSEKISTGNKIGRNGLTIRLQVSRNDKDGYRLRLLQELPESTAWKQQ